MSTECSVVKVFSVGLEQGSSVHNGKGNATFQKQALGKAK